MDDKKARLLVIITAFLLVMSGCILFWAFKKQGIEKKSTNNYSNYNINDYVEIYQVPLEDYNDVFNSINVSKINIKNIDRDIEQEFIDKQNTIIKYITDYYNQIKRENGFQKNNSVSSTIKAQINESSLSIFYRLDFILDKTIFIDNEKSFIITLNIDLTTNKVLTKENLLLKYNYTRNYISDKLFNDDVLINKGQIVIDKNTNISLNRNDIEKNKEKYVERIILEFDNIIEMYIENNELVLVYDAKKIKNIFFKNEFETNIKYRYLK